VRAAALLPELPDETLAELPYTGKPYWPARHALGRRRAGRQRRGRRRQGTAPRWNAARACVRGHPPLTRSAWLAVRILPAAHTNPVFVIVAERPIRASRRSIQGCLAGVARCWSQQARFIAPSEHAEAQAAYEHARVVYRRRLAECDAE
jgi:hypothetical protein